uniref:Uncharacterized protein n=1 Tax=Setaria digitata TaxID=48799 RepID=A0A915PRB1_9BILA
MLGDGRIAYYAGKEGNQEQVCVTEILPDETLHLSLFVGTTSESTAYERIRNQLLPVIPDSQTTTPSMTASRLSSQTTSFILLALLLFIISK